MEGEECGGKRRGPEPVRGLIQEQKQEEHRAEVEQEAHQMVAGGVIPEQGPVQRMGKYRQGNPVFLHNRRKSRLKALPAPSGLHDGVFGDIAGIVEVDEVVASDPAESQQCGYHQQCDHQIKMSFHKL